MIQIQPLTKKPALLITRFPYESAWGGEESHTLQLARHFRDRGYEVIFLGNCPVLLERFKNENFRTQNVNGGQMIVTPFLLLKSLFLAPWWRRNMHRAFEQLIQEYNLKALYCHSLNEKLFLTPLALKHGVSVTWVEHQEIRDWLLKSPWKRLYKKYANQVKIIPISPKNKEILQEQLSVLPENRIDIIHGIALNEIMNQKRQTQKGLIVAANRLIPKKGMMDILEAFSLLLKSRPNLILHLVGEGPEKELLQAKIQTLKLQNKVQLSAPLAKEVWHQLLSEADVYVSAARDFNETFSLNTAEALAAGCKVVVTSCSGIASQLKDHKDAFLAQPHDSQNLAENITLALQTSEEMRKNAQNTASEKFDLKRMLSEYEAVIFRNL